MTKLTSLIITLALAACGGKSKPAPAPAPAPEPAPVAAVEPEPEPEPAPEPPPPSLPGWYATADVAVILADDGAATLVKKGGKATKGKWDATASTLTLKGSKPTPVKLDGSALVVTIGGKEKTLPRQPQAFEGTTFANDAGSLQLNADGTCLQGKGGIPSKCTYALADGKLKITYDEPKQKPVTWAVWFDETSKIMHTPKETLTATE